MYDLTGRRKRFDLPAQEPEVGDTEAPALPPPLAAKAAALASLENGTEDLQVVAPSPRKPLVHREAPAVNAPPVKSETPAGVRDAEMEAAKELDSDAYSKFLFETATRQLIGGLTLTKPEATISQRSAGAVKGLVDKRAKAKADALKAMELGMKASDYERQVAKDAEAKARDERDFAWRAKEKDEDQAGSAESRRLQAETNRLAMGLRFKEASAKDEERGVKREERDAKEAADSMPFAGGTLKVFRGLSDTERNQARSKSSLWNAALTGMDTLEQKLNAFVANPSRETKAEVDATVSTVSTALNAAQGQGAMAEAEARRIAETLGADLVSPGGAEAFLRSMAGENPQEAGKMLLAKLKAARSVAKTSALGTLSSYGDYSTGEQSAAPAAPARKRAKGPNGEVVEWDGKQWVKVTP